MRSLWYEQLICIWPRVFGGSSGRQRDGAQLRVAKHKLWPYLVFAAVGLFAIAGAMLVWTLCIIRTNAAELAREQEFLDGLCSAPGAEVYIVRKTSGCRTIRWLAGELTNDIPESDREFVRYSPESGLDGIFNRVVALRARPHVLQSEALAPIRELGNLESLAIEFVPGDFERASVNMALHAIEGVDHLKLLSIKWGEVDADGWQTIGTLVNLETLEIEGSGATAEEFAEVRRLKSLRSLSTDGYDFSDEWVQHLRALPDLESVRLDAGHLTDDGVRQLVALPGLKVLSVKSPQMKQVEVTDCQSLERLTLCEGGMRSVKLCNLPELEFLNIVSYELEEVVFQRLPKLARFLLVYQSLKRITVRDLPNLCELEFKGDASTEVSIGSVPHLEKLFVFGVPLANLPLSEMKSLRSLMVTEGPVTRADVLSLMRLERLEYLTLSTCSLDEGCLDGVSSRSQLQGIYLMGADLDDGGLMALARLPKLRLLGISGTDVTKQGIDEFRRAKPSVKIEDFRANDD